MSLKESIKGLGNKIDRKALASAVGLMLISWAALPIIYWLIVKSKKKKNVQNTEEKAEAKEEVI